MFEKLERELERKKSRGSKSMFIFVVLSSSKFPEATQLAMV
jgi:hypothetical protein